MCSVTYVCTTQASYVAVTEKRQGAPWAVVGTIKPCPHLLQCPEGPQSSVLNWSKGRAFWGGGVGLHPSGEAPWRKLSSS